jgi:hypothetical protein
MPDFLDDTRKEITDRLKELKPLVDEYSRLKAAAAALQGVGGASASATVPAPTRRRGPGRPRGSTNRKTATSVAPAKPARKKAGRPPGRKKAGRRPGRRKGTGTRAAAALSFVQGQPGITIPELAAKMGIKQNYLYRVLPGLAKDGKVEKNGRGWVVKGA